MLEYFIHGLLAVPLAFANLKCLSYLAEEPITRAAALLVCTAAFLLGTVTFVFHGVVFIFLGTCAIAKFLGKRGGWFDKPI